MPSEIHNFLDFCVNLKEVGFTTGGANGEGVFTLCDYFAPEIEWHTGNLETDPWAWRIRGVTEVAEFGYGKLFLRKSGWITREWYPYFLAVRREAQPLEALYSAGKISQLEREAYAVICEAGQASLKHIKLQLGITKENKSKFDTAITGLQMKQFITLAGETRKESYSGKEYGWPVTVFCTVEDFFGEKVVEEAREVGRDAAIEAITKQILKLNPNATPKAMKRFIGY